MGAVERASRRAPAARTMVIIAVPVDNPDTANGAAYAERGAFVVPSRKPPVAATK